MSNVNISWSGSLTENYELQYRKVSDNWSVVPGSPFLGTNATLTGLDDNTEYQFRVKSEKCGSWVVYSFTTPVSGCVAPSGLVFENLTTTSVSLRWVNHNSSVNGVKVEWKFANASVWSSVSLATGTTSFALNGLVPNTDYVFRVTSVCLNGATSSSQAVFFKTNSISQLCDNISLSNLTVTTLPSDTYQITWSNNGIPSTVQIEVGLSAGSFTQSVNILNQTPTSITYKLPLVTQFPETHFVKLTPRCSDNSSGVVSIFNYVKPVIVPNNITLSNQSIGTLDLVYVNTLPISTTSTIAPNSSQVLRHPLLTNTPVRLSATLTNNILDGKFVKISNTRGSNITELGYTTVVNANVVLVDNFTFQNGDVLNVSPDDKLRVNAQLVLECINGDCTRQGSLRITVKLDRVIPQAAQFKLAYSYRDILSNTLKILGCNVLPATPVGYTCDNFCNEGFEFTIPANQQIFTTSLLGCVGTPLSQAPCQPCATPITKIWLKPIGIPSLELLISGLDSSNNNSAVQVEQI